MKKYLMFMLAAALFASCSDDEKLPKEDETPGDTNFEEHDGYFVYYGETYKTIKLANGTTWMAEPLRYVPEGYTPSSDPTADAHIWYPYQLTGITDKATAGGAEALTDEASIKKLGYLYDLYAALGGKEVTEENCYEFEGAQGICPEGWHIPTRLEFVGLCGLSNKAVGETGNMTKNDALFYDEAYSGGNMNKYNAAGWNYVLSGVRMQSTFAATPTYQLTTFYSGNTTSETLEKYKGQPALTYIMSSTCYAPLYLDKTDPTKLTNIQFFAQMTTFTKSYPEGRINVPYISIKSGQQLRCVKDQAAN
ncbi:MULTISPECIES: FISUMP domain-containing protein [Bacteroides]|uniref:Fibrobacter succinogenes major paralogous domain-containing protein n=1 Tax=Bacteroides caecimuris TaxID=1796613 RepID=A0A4V3RIF0_9BACE|nr:FISUMP domain-containing protein [Bacteroides caecimuris]TGY31650.1 hypothetical protein E5353_12960 [Bacteroides caecimuris]